MTRLPSLRTLVRYRAELIQHRAPHILHMQKALQQMNVQRERVLSDIMGSTGQLILRAIVAGERDPIVLAQHRNPAGKSSTDTIAKALTGTWKDELIFVLTQALVIYDVYTAQIAVCDGELEQYLQRMEARSGEPDAPVPDLPPAKTDSHAKNAPRVNARAHDARLLGVDLVAVMGLSSSSVQTIISEIGTDMSRFPTVKHFAALARASNRATTSRVAKCCVRGRGKSPIARRRRSDKPLNPYRAPTRRSARTIDPCERAKGQNKPPSPPRTKSRGLSTTC